MFSSKETSAAALDEAGSTSLLGDNNDGLYSDTDDSSGLFSEKSTKDVELRAVSDAVMNLSDPSSSNESIPGRDADLFFTGALNNNDDVTPEEEIRHVLLNPADFTRNSYRYFWNQSKGRG